MFFITKSDGSHPDIATPAYLCGFSKNGYRLPDRVMEIVTYLVTTCHHYFL